MGNAECGTVCWTGASECLGNIFKSPASGEKKWPLGGACGVGPLIHSSDSPVTTQIEPSTVKSNWMSGRACSSCGRWCFCSRPSLEG